MSGAGRAGRSRRRPVRGGQLIAAGSFAAPSTSGTYVFEVSSLLACTVTELRDPPEPTPISRAAIVPGSVVFSVNVAPTSHGVVPSMTTRVRQERPPPPLEAPSNGEIVVPAEGAVITQTHTRFRWPEIVGIPGDYVLELVEDDGSGDPFTGGPPVTTHVIGGSEPRAVVTQGLEFGGSYAWRVYEQGGAPTPNVHRFETAPLPPEVPAIGVTTGTGPLEPGVIVFGLRGVQTNHKGLVVAVDEAGVVVHFLESQQDRINDVRQIPTGQLLIGKFPDTPSGTKGRAVVVTTRGGKAVWASPDAVDMGGGDLFSAHHEAALGPDGDYLLLVRESQDRTVMGVTERWRGDKVVLLDRQTSEVIWSWSTFDHYSLQDDGIDWNTGMPYGPRDWTHGNGAIYHPQDGDVYFSARNISRVTRIAFATGAVVYDMGMDMPSGDTDFGDGLFSNQHAPQMLPNGNMMLFDNGNLNVPLPLESSAKELAFDDPVDPTSATIVWEYCALDRDGVTPLFTPLFGDADRLPGGNTLVAFGSASIIDEVRPDGSLARRIDVGGVGSPDYFLYRADHVAELIRGTPGDVDEDEDVDLLDLAALAATPVLAGPLPFPAALLDLDGDGALDQTDLSLLLEEMTGPGREYP